jgi:hypothetical protein
MVWQMNIHPFNAISILMIYLDISRQPCFIEAFNKPEIKGRD